MVRLNDGTTLTVPPTIQVAVAAVQPGKAVEADYQDRAGEKVVTYLRVTPEIEAP